MAAQSQSGFGPVLANRPFRALWTAQALAQTAQNGINFMQMVLIEHMTGSSTHLGLMILAFTLPGILVSPIAGVVVDHIPKKWVLIASNALRVILTLGYFLVLGRWEGWSLLLAVYAIAFVASTVGQFFSPAEAATIPLLVGRHNLVAANALFNLTLAGSQVVGLIILGPLIVKAVGIRGGFIVIAVMYVLATLSVAQIPRDRVRSHSAEEEGVGAGWERLRANLKEGWAFVLRERTVAVAMSHLTVIATLIMILAMLTPGFAARVLGMAPEDAVLVFAPAGVGMLLATGALGRWGYRLRKDVLGHLALLAAGLSFAGLGILSRSFLIHRAQMGTTAGLGLLSAVIGLSFLLGMSMSAANILAQTIVQEETPAPLRGRVFAVQYMLNNLVGIPPMLTIAGLADWLGIPPVLIGVACAVLLATGISAYVRYGRPNAEWLRPPIRLGSEPEPTSQSRQDHAP
ncbi:MAG: MFS transporter [Chloroflexi bacterium]|nr:MFS transporter [Chloroflexota bacterium]